MKKSKIILTFEIIGALFVILKAKIFSSSLFFRPNPQVSIDVKEKLYIVNFFHNKEDHPKGYDPRHPKYDLCTDYGVDNIKKHYQKSNIGFIESTSSYFYINKSNNEIVVLSYDFPNLIETYEENVMYYKHHKQKDNLILEENRLKNHKEFWNEFSSEYSYLGMIEDEIGRYMFVDEGTFNKLGLEKDRYNEIIKVDIQSGTLTSFDGLSLEEKYKNNYSHLFVNTLKIS